MILFDDEYCMAYSVMYLLYPTVHFQKLGRIVQGLVIFLDIETLCHSLFFVICAFDFPLAKKVIAASAQDV